MRPRCSRPVTAPVPSPVVSSTSNPPALVTGGKRARPPLFKHPGRIAIVVLGLIAVVNLGVFVLAKSDTSRESSTGLPIDIVSLQPRPGELIRPQDTVTAQVRTSLTGVLVLDGQEIPEDQTDRVPELGEISFRPGAGKDLRQFPPGTHTLVVKYWLQGKARPAHPAAFAWTFRVGA